MQIESEQIPAKNSKLIWPIIVALVLVIAFGVWVWISNQNIKNNLSILSDGLGQQEMSINEINNQLTNINNKLTNNQNESENLSNNNEEDLSNPASELIFNSEFGFSIKYPSSYKMKDVSASDNPQFLFEGLDDSFIINVKNVSQWNPYLFDRESDGSVVFSRIDWAQYILSDGYCDGPDCTSSLIAFKTLNDGLEYVVIFYGQTIITDKINEIMSSWRFN